MTPSLDHPLDDLGLSRLGSPELSRVDDVCEEFEAAWARGEAPPIEELLDRVEARCRPWLLFELLSLEFAFREQEGFDVEEYRRRFADQIRVVDRSMRHHLGEAAGDVPQRPEWLRSDVGSESGVQLPDDYEVLEEIGRGGQGIVFKARKRSLDCHVAVKVVLQASRTSVDRLQREAKTVAKVQHPNIVAVHEIGTHGGIPYLVMQYIEGGNLAQLAREQRFDDRRCAGYIGMAARAIAAAHREGVLHRDIKPSNILVDRDQRVLVTDFGLAKSLTGDVSPTRTGDVLGTVNYMPPEQANGRMEDVGKTADVYSLGAVLYELLTGRPPIVGDSFVDTLRRLGTEPIMPPREIRPDVHPDLDAICMKCLQTDPADRYATASELADELSRVRRGLNVRTTRTAKSTSTEPPEAWWRSSAVAAMSVVTAVCLACVLFVIWPRGGDGGAGGGFFGTGVQLARTSLVPPPGEWVRFPVDDTPGSPTFEVRALRDLEGDTGPQREVLIVTSKPINARRTGQETAILRIDLDRLERDDKLSIVDGYVWLGPPERVLAAVVFGSEYSGGVDRFAGWNDTERLPIRTAVARLTEVVGSDSPPENMERGTGGWPAITLDRVVENLAPLPESLPEVHQFKRYTFDFETDEGTSDCEIEVRGIGDEGTDRWLLLQVKTTLPGGASLWESGLVRVDVASYESEKRLPVEEGSVWIGDRDTITRNGTVDGAPFAENMDELRRWHSGPGARFAVRDALHLLYDAEVWPRRTVARRPLPSIGWNERVAAEFLPVQRFLDKIVVPPSELPYDLAALPKVGKRGVFWGSITHPGLPLGEQILYEVDIQGIADGKDGRDGQRLIAIEVRSGENRDAFPEAALLWVDVEQYHDRRRLGVVDGFEWIGSLESLRDGQREHLVEFHPQFDQLKDLHESDGPLRLAVRDVLVLMFGAEASPSAATLSQVRSAFTRVRERQGLEVSHETETYHPAGEKPIECRVAGVEALPLNGDGAAALQKLTTRFLSNRDVPCWVFANADLELENETLFHADLKVIGRPQPIRDGEALYEKIRTIGDGVVPTRPFDLAWLPEKDGIGARYSGELVAYHPVTLEATGAAYDLVLRTVATEVGPDGRMYRRIEIEMTANLHAGGTIKEVASVLVHMDEAAETTDFGESLIHYGNGEVEEFDPESEDTRKSGFGVREVLYLLFNAKQVDTANIWVKDLRWYLSGRRRKEHPTKGATTSDGYPTSYFALSPTSVNTTIGRRGRFEYRFSRSEDIPFGFHKAAAEVRDEATGRKLFEATLDFERIDDGIAEIDPVAASDAAAARERKLKSLRDTFNRLIRLSGRGSYSRLMAIVEEVFRDYPDSDLAIHVERKLKEAGVSSPRTMRSSQR